MKTSPPRASAEESFQSPSLAEQVARAREAFAEIFGQSPQWVAAAPGRVNLIGEHTDYNQGYVLPLAIERYTVMVAGRPLRVGGAGRTRVASGLMGETAEFELTDLQPARRDWTSYVRGALAGCLARGLAPGSLDVLVDSTVPLGAGLSSSAALEVATATLVEAVTRQSLDPYDKARLCQQAEHEYAGMPCGIMDQLSSVLGAAGQVLWIDCRTETATLVPLDDRVASVLVINSNVRHDLTGSEYPDRRRQCEQAARVMGVASLRDATPTDLESHRLELGELLHRRARHVVDEIERTRCAAEALARSQWPLMGELMYASHESLRDDFEVSCPELDVLAEIARSIGPAGGVIGSRMTGGGFGGCTVSLVEAGRERAVAERIAAEYRQRTGIEATAFVTKPARGAHVVG